MKGPWSWPIEVPVRVQTGRCIVRLTRRGAIYDSAANVGKGYTGVIERGSGPDGSPPFTLSYCVSRGYLRGKLRSGEWSVYREPEDNE